jgi:hypothetical protein
MRRSWESLLIGVYGSRVSDALAGYPVFSRMNTERVVGMAIPAFACPPKGSAEMSRTAVFQSALLLCLLAVQGLMFYRIEHLSANTAAELVVKTQTQMDPALRAIPAQGDQAAVLARIDARLAALETQAASSSAPPLPQKIVLGSPEALAADRKIASLLPKSSMTQQELTMFEAQLGQFSPDERHQLSAALARAINNGRIQVGPE